MIVLDTIFFGERGNGQFGIVALKGNNAKRILFAKEVTTERIEDYKEGVKYLQKEGWIIDAIVGDGKKGFFTAFGDIPVQMCQVHQMRIITRYLTLKPKSEANRELLKIACSLTKIDRKHLLFNSKNGTRSMKNISKNMPLIRKERNDTLTKS